MSNGRSDVVFSTAKLATSERLAVAFGAVRIGRRQENKGAVRMKLWAGVVRRVGVAVSSSAQ